MRLFHTDIPFPSSEGFIAMHDVILNRFDPEIEVHRFWDELKVSEERQLPIVSDAPDTITLRTQLGQDISGV